jgi:hypothetical protein
MLNHLDRFGAIADDRLDGRDGQPDRDRLHRVEVILDGTLEDAPPAESLCHSVGCHSGLRPLRGKIAHPPLRGGPGGG